MSINVKCPNRSCDQQLSLSPEMAGKKGQCPKCGKSFQIPAKLGEKAGKKKASAANAGASAKPKPAPAEALPKPAPPAEQVMAANELADFLVEEEEIIEGAEIIETGGPGYGAPAAAGYGGDPFGDPYGGDPFADPYGGSAGGVRKGAVSKSKKWSLVSIGFLIVAISVCVYAGSFAMMLMSEGFFQLAAPARSGNMARAAVTLLKVAGIFGLIASVGMITGYVFFVFVPNKNATLGLSIATLSLGVVNFVLGLIFRVIPVFTTGSVPHFRTTLAGWMGGDARHLFGNYSFSSVDNVGHEIFMMFLEFGIAAEFMLLALFMAAVAKSHSDRRHKNDCMRMVWFLTAFAGVVLVMSIFMFLDVSGRWQFYTVRVFNWAANGLFVAVLVFMIMNLFFSRKETR